MSTLQSRVIEFVLSSRLASARRRAVDVIARVRGEAPTITLYYQTGDAYSHLCAQLLATLRNRVDAALRVVIVPTVADATNAAPALGPAYAIRDAVRIAPAWGLAMPDDACTPSARSRDAAERVLLAADGIGEFLAREPQVVSAMWADDVEAVNALPMLDTAEARLRLEANQQELHGRGHYQGGMWHFRGDWYWALDRLPYLEDRLRRMGRVRGTQPLAQLTPAKARLPEQAGKHGLRLFYSFRSPYSYIVAERARDLAKRHDTELLIRPVLPMVMRGLKVPKAKRVYIARDAKREADWLGIPFGRIADPLGGGVERCLAVFPAADAAGHGVDFLIEAGRAIWSRGEDIRQDRLFRAVLQRAGLDVALAEQTCGDAGDIEYAEANRKTLFDLGLWGVPSFQFGALAVWGQDRLWLVEEALTRARSR